MATERVIRASRLLQSNEYSDLDNAAAAAEANRKWKRVETTIRRDYAWLAANLVGKSDLVTALDAKLKLAGLEWVRIQLGGNGINFADTETQRMIDGLEQASLFTAEQASQLRGVGVRLISSWEDLGESEPLTEAEVAEARDQLAQVAIVRKVADRYNAVVAAITAGQITTLEAAAAALGAAL